MVAVQAGGGRAHEPSEGRIEDGRPRRARGLQVIGLRIEARDLEGEVREAGVVASPGADARSAIPRRRDPPQTHRLVRRGAAAYLTVVRPHRARHAASGYRRNLLVRAAKSVRRIDYPARGRSFDGGPGASGHAPDGSRIAPAIRLQHPP